MTTTVHSIVQDLRLALRTIRRAPFFATMVIATLAIGIGVNTTMFSIVDAVLLRSMPYPQADRVTMLGYTVSSGDSYVYGLRGYEYWALRDGLDAIDAIGVYDYGGGTLSGDGGYPEEPTSLGIDGGLQEILGLEPIVGRRFDEQDFLPGNDDVLMLGEEIWRRRYNADPNLIGRDVLLNEEPTRVVGIVPGTFRFPDETTAIQIFLPRRMDRELDYWSLGFVARLAEGATGQQLQAQLDAVAVGLAEERPDMNTHRGFFHRSLHEHAVGSVRSSLFLLWGAVGFVLLLACMNAANLLFARATARSHEIAVCAAIGSPRSRIIQRVLVESTLLAVVAGVLGLLIAQWGVEAIAAYGTENLPRGADISVAPRVFAFTFAMALLTGLLYGLLPALQLSRVDLSELIKHGGSRGSTAGAGLRLRAALTVGQVAIAIVLLIGAGLMIRSSMEIHSTDPGFVYEDVVALQMWSDTPRDEGDDGIRRFYSAVTAEIEKIPGIRSANLVSGSPWHFMFNTSTKLLIDGHPEFADAEAKLCKYRVVSTDYLSELEVPLLAGRHLNERDDENGAVVVVVSRSFAERYWPDGDPVGQLVRVGSEAIPVEIVGVVGDIRERRLDRAAVPMLYLSFRQNTQVAMSVMVRADRDVEALERTIQEAVWAINPTQGIWRTQTLEDSLRSTLARERLYLVLLIVFAAVAIVLATIGIFGVISYSVTRRTREIGIRMALGATHGEVRADVLKRGLGLSLIGLVIGLPAAVLLTRFLKSQLYEVGTLDPMTYAAVSALVLVVAAAACYLPAFRATRIEPATCLRVE